MCFVKGSGIEIKEKKKPIGIRLNELSLTEGNDWSYTSGLVVIKSPPSHGTIEILTQTGSMGKA